MKNNSKNHQTVAAFLGNLRDLRVSAHNLEFYDIELVLKVAETRVANEHQKLKRAAPKSGGGTSRKLRLVYDGDALT